MRRDTGKESELLERAVEYLPDRQGSFVVTAAGRLDEVEARLGGNSSWESRTAAAIAGEMADEGIDIGCWGVGLAYKIDSSGLSEIRREQHKIKLVRAIAHGALSWHEITELAAKLDF